jgi:hypothetical protein
MKLVWSILPIVSLCLTASANQKPTGFLDTLKMSPSIEEFRSSNADTCTDFSGDWKGTCMASGVKKDEAFTIKQTGCTAVEVTSGTNKVTMPIGGVLSIGGSIPGAPAMTFGGTIQSNWNQDMTELQVSAMGGAKKLELNASPHGGAFFESVKMKDGKLYVDIYAMGGHSMIAFCEFTK